MNLRFPPAPSSGTTMSFARELRVLDHFAWSKHHAKGEMGRSKISRQYAIGCEAKV